MNDKIRIGACIELNCLEDNFDSCFFKLESFINNYSFLFDNQCSDILLTSFKCFHETLSCNISVLLNDIDKNEFYCEYMKRFN